MIITFYYWEFIQQQVNNNNNNFFDFSILNLIFVSYKASLAYLISVLTKRELSQLVGVISILVCMMFSGKIKLNILLNQDI